MLSDINSLEQALSPERFNRYVCWADGDRHRALALYTLNTQLSESLYTPLHMLEIVLRNRIHSVLAHAHGELWFQKSDFLLGQHQSKQLSDVTAEIRKTAKPVTAGKIVSGLTFSFWTAMLGRDYEPLWQTTLHRIARKPDGKGLRRKDFSTPLDRIRKLRNRIAHHEPILMWDLPIQHATILELVTWMSPSAALWCQGQSRFPHIYPSGGILLTAETPPPPSPKMTTPSVVV